MKKYIIEKGVNTIRYFKCFLNGDEVWTKDINKAGLFNRHSLNIVCDEKNNLIHAHDEERIKEVNITITKLD